MKIGIIGAGNIGGTLTRRLTALGHEVRVSNSRAPETLAELATETGATPVWAADAADDADLVIISIPQKNTPDLAKGIVDKRKPGAPVIETNNYYPQQRDGYIEAIEQGQPESAGSPSRSARRCSRRSTGSGGSACSTTVSPKVRRAGSRCRSREPTALASRSCSS